jgi:hypothetical protein
MMKKATIIAAPPTTNEIAAENEKAAEKKVGLRRPNSAHDKTMSRSPNLDKLERHYDAMARHESARKQRSEHG